MKYRGLWQICEQPYVTYELEEYDPTHQWGYSQKFNLISTNFRIVKKFKHYFHLNIYHI